MEYELYKKLTKRQLEIADCARRGFTDGQIANALDISIFTVKTHLKNIYEKMEVSGRTELAGLSDWHEIENKTKFTKLQFPKKNDHITQSADKSQLVVCKSAEIVYKIAAQIFRSVIDSNITPSIILPTGRVASLLFRSLCDCADKGEITDLSRSIFFIDTETFGVTINHPASRQYFVRDSFFFEMIQRNVTIPKEEKLFFFNGVYDYSDPCDEIDVALRKYPPHLHIVSVSPEGEVIGYEPGKYKKSHDLLYKKAEIIHLTEKAKHYIDSKQPASAILSIGFGNMLSAKQLLLIVAGKSKKQVLKKIITGNKSPLFPVTLLRDHGNLTILTDTSTVENVINDDEEILIIKDVQDYFNY
jgi:6-phosphogluconolactonase/glucosamine-6-phosphate isomerase/deaminase/DNA-binding CsgD family transcriptional regulator